MKIKILLSLFASLLLAATSAQAAEEKGIEAHIVLEPAAVMVKGYEVNNYDGKFKPTGLSDLLRPWTH